MHTDKQTNSPETEKQDKQNVLGLEVQVCNLN